MIEEKVVREIIMNNTTDPKAFRIMAERFGHNSTISLATIDGGNPAVRTVNAFYDNGAFYIVTYALSNKITQIKANPSVAVCGEWMTARGIGENLGWVLDDKNAEIMAKLRTAFASWYGNGHTDESSPNTCLLRVRLTDAVLFSHGTKYIMEFTGGVNGDLPC